MKFSLFCLGLITLISMNCSNKPRNTEGLFQQIENQEIIDKSELEKNLSFGFGEYEDQFIGTGDVISSGEIRAGIIEGKKRDTVFDVLVVYKGDENIMTRENPHSSFYVKGKTVVREYRLGNIYTVYPDYDTNCIRAYFELIQPVKTDALGYEFQYLPPNINILYRDSIDFCHKGAKFFLRISLCLSAFVALGSC